MHFWDAYVRISIKISLKFVFKSPKKTTIGLHNDLAPNRIGDKPLSEMNDLRYSIMKHEY